jgi:acyl-CoA thioester hydrolase
MEYTFKPRFNDTDALGHINNASIATWFEEGRRSIFEYFIPDLDPKKWNLIIARLEIDYLAQGYYQKPVTVKTHVEKIGNSSFVLVQEALQDGVVISRGKSFLVCFDYTKQKSFPIPEEIKTKLRQHLLNVNLEVIDE